MPIAMRITLLLALLATFSLGQDPSEDTPSKSNNDKAPKEGDAAAKPNGKNASAKPESAPEKGERVVKVKKKDQVKVLRPDEVPQELARLKSKADIKAEITVKPHHGKPAIFKGVIRNGKLIERFVGRNFVALKSIKANRSGVRLWWIGGSDGWMFFRYSNILSISITGKLTAKERAEILRRLEAARQGKTIEENKPKVKPTEDLDAQLAKLTKVQLAAYLLKTFPAKEGWDRKRYRALKRKQVIDNIALKRDEGLFVRYFRDLIKARLKQLENAPSNKTEIEPGSDNTAETDKSPSRDKDAPVSSGG